MVSSYDYFAWFYDRYWGEPFAARIFPTIQKLVLARLKPPARVLDLCCGTGHLSALMLRKGYQVVGLDNSEDMLDFARQHAPTATFRLADARSFSLEKPCDAAVSTYDSLNHIMTLSDLRQVFANVASALVPGAPFLFDLNMETAFVERWHDEKPFSFLGDDHACICKSAYDDKQKIANLQVAMFRLTNGIWERRDVTHTQRAYTVDEITIALEQAGFRGPELCDAKGEAALETSGRFFFVASRR